MNIKLKSITLHHFLSFGESTVSLDDRGFCLVSGINRNPKDAAKSNGSGKSTIFNAISFVLTGETLQGLKSNLGNIYYNDGCWVSLEFTLDGHEYVLLRSKDDDKYGTNLKITVDGEDKSGKGIRESEEVLANLIPDITSELIGSVILIGQGMPQKFTSNTPSKRKEILEHLSKSDYMIQDLKNRVEARSVELSKKVRESEDKILSDESKFNVYNQQLESAKAELIEASKPTDYDAQIASLSAELDRLTGEESKTISDGQKLTEEAKKAHDEYTKVNEEKQNAVRMVRDQHDAFVAEFNERGSEITKHIFALTSEISRLESIRDICPTCGQKIPGAVKPDTTKQKQELVEWQKKEADLKEEKNDDSIVYQNTLTAISEKFDADIASAKKAFDDIQLQISTLNGNLTAITRNKTTVSTNLTNVKNLKANHENNIIRIQGNITELSKNVTSLETSIKTEKETLEDLNKHLDVISKMNTYLKRDFRGYLLADIISYISAKAKEYCAQIFGSDEIMFALNGNNIDIAYSGKDYENLSGGEKQRVDLIIQFAIRSLLVNYLGFNSNILVLDEITDNLDSVSCDKVLNFITNELNQISSVFIISHHSDELSIPCDSEIIVEKNSEGVSNVI